MSKLKPTPELLEDILARVPEGFLRRTTFSKRFDIYSKNGAKNLNQALAESKIIADGDIVYDPARVSVDYVREVGKIYRPAFPLMSSDGKLQDLPVGERSKSRQEWLLKFGGEHVLSLMQRLEQTAGYAPVHEICQRPEEELAARNLVSTKLLCMIGDYVYDPLRVGQETIQEIVRQSEAESLKQQLTEFLSAKPAQTADLSELNQIFGAEAIKEVLSLGGFSTFTISMKTAPFTATWVRLKNSNHQEAQNIAKESVRIKDEDWEEALNHCGSVLRLGARDGKTRRVRVIARSYTINSAAAYLRVRETTLENALRQSILPVFIDPEGRKRIAAEYVETVANDPELTSQIEAFERLKVHDIALVSETSYTTIWSRLKREDINRHQPRWGQVCGKWGLPTTLSEFREILKTKRAEKRLERSLQREEDRRLQREEMARREALRARLVAAFPTWQHEQRAEQHITLHIGPPNSGKTHDALNVLAEVNNGWYLAPLRLLAFEVFDRLNRRGVLCNLLTGEEYIPVPGAKITAATIEMFNPDQSGTCVIIDEAQMLADPDRGWAWTRALMEARSPEIHVIGPPVVQALIERLANAAAIPLHLMEHQRLAPLQVAANHWTLQDLPERTILVAFSRQTVLHLKTDLERMKRTVSVVYGNLPPEVRRKQADRFADGLTEICVATDAVGMGLNLPADNVCFYEVEKFDGKQTRFLYPSEVHQIGGRAGRYGFSTAGEIGATSKRDLNLIRKLYNTAPEMLSHARVAPSVEDLEMIPGSLAQKLSQWAAMESIPESLRGAIKTADLSERIELANMLTNEQVQQLGLEAALRLVNAPTRQSTRSYWLMCAQAILGRKPMPLPPDAPLEITDSFALEAAENSIASADIYLWLGNRREFGMYALHQPHIREERKACSTRIDHALLHKLDTARRCNQCGRPLPLHYHYRICNKCYNERFLHYDDYESYA